MLLSGCNNAFYNPFTGDTYLNFPDHTITPDPTPDPTAEPTPDGSNETPETAEPIILVGGTADIDDDSTDTSQAVTFSGEIGNCLFPYTAPGNDLFYSIILTAGDNIEIVITPIADWDPVIYLFTNSSDPEGSCVAGVDDEMSGTAEILQYTVPAGQDGEYIIGIDCAFSIVTPGGLYNMAVTVN